MIKIIWKEPKEDEPIFKTVFIISNPEPNFNKKRKGENKWKKLFFFSFPINKIRKDTNEVIKMLSLQMGGNFKKNQKGVRINIESV